jgi:flagellum-specific peptidoglycan hydrolase FlgJ
MEEYPMKKRKNMRKALAMLAALLILLGQGGPAVGALTVMDEDTTEAVNSSPSEGTEKNEPSETSDAKIEGSVEATTETTTQPSQSDSSNEFEDSSSTEPSSSDESTSTTESTSSSESGTTSTSTSGSSESTTESTKDSTSTTESESSSVKPSETSESSRPNHTTTSSSKDSSEVSTGTDNSTGPVAPSFQPSGASVDLAKTLVTTPTDSNLNGYELPLLNQLANKQSAALISEALKQLGKPYEKDGKGSRFSNLSLPVSVYQSVFGLKDIKSYQDLSQTGKETSLEKAVPGDLLFWKEGNKIVKSAIYLGQDKLIMADQPKDQQISEDTSAETNGVRIYTISKQELESDQTEKQLENDDYVNKPDLVIHFDESKELTAHGKDLIEHYAASYDFRKNAQTEAFIASIAEDARDLGLTYDVYASVMIAQAILESGSGQSGLATAPYYNLFGIKGSAGGNSVSMTTSEDNGAGKLYSIQAAFRTYTGYKESLKDYVQLLRTGISGNNDFYKNTWRSEAKNYLQATEYLTGRYATDTSYNNKLNSLIAAYGLTQYDKPKAGNGIVLQSKESIPEEYRKLLVFPDYNGVNYNTSGSYPAGQCTWYAYNRVKQLGGSVDEYMGNGGEWGTTAKRLGYKTSTSPKAGYLISFHPGVAGSSSQYGHVAFVEAVGDDGILISEGNVIDGKTISYRIIPNELAYSQSVSYIAPK